jgi:hypothetical protein
VAFLTTAGRAACETHAARLGRPSHLQRDREFESGSLQRRVCKLSVPAYSEGSPSRLLIRLRQRGRGRLLTRCSQYRVWVVASAAAAVRGCPSTPGCLLRDRR